MLRLDQLPQPFRTSLELEAASEILERSWLYRGAQAQVIWCGFKLDDVLRATLDQALVVVACEANVKGAFNIAQAIVGACGPCYAVFLTGGQETVFDELHETTEGTEAGAPFERNGLWPDAEVLLAMAPEGVGDFSIYAKATTSGTRFLMSDETMMFLAESRLEANAGIINWRMRLPL